MAHTTNIDTLLTRGVDALFPSKEAFEKRLTSGKRMRIYVGFDPTAPQLHIGHALQLRKLKEFQDLGHEVIMLVGSFTGMIGDPTDKAAARTQLTQKEVLKNAATYKKQAGKILSFSGKNAARILFNHKWLSKMSFQDVVELASHFTVQQMSERDMFDKRLKEGKPIHLHEFMYPLMQGYDSVEMDVDVEIGGSDQMFNMLAGRTLMRAMKQKEKLVLTLKLLTNDEGKKMSKSEGGFIALGDAPEDMFGKIMSMHDSMILSYFELITDVPVEEIEGMRVAMNEGMNPRDMKVRLARKVVTMFHDAKAAEKANEHFEQVFSRKEFPEDMPTFKATGGMQVIDVLEKTELVSSRSEARRLISQNAIKLDGVVVKTPELMVEEGVLQRGKRQFVKLEK